MKKNIVYGVEMSFIQEMMFAKYLMNNRIAMNCISKEKGTQITKEWLNNNKHISNK